MFAYTYKLYDIYVERVTKKRRWTSLMTQLHRLSHAQSLALLVEIFHDTLQNDRSLPPPAKNTLRDLYHLFAFFHMETHAYDFFRSGAAPQRDLDELPNRVRHLMARIEPHAVALVDAWKIPDYLLDSALGRFDGKVYEDLFHRAHRLNPLNEITFNPNYWEDELVKGDGGGWSSVLAKL
ncbi:fatty-acyl coenzyme A oxidase (Pox1) [Aspergillus flavus]|nr:fatty-acyl coenzyme A oxidase (Pox1) [Aspergillus flavus]RAQ72224.1 fatty-acyl coenzyme A oxidase (Pox1) [Aspergillus flavus]